MKIYICLLIIIFLNVEGCASWGGGGGKYYPPQVSLNKLNLIKKTFSQSGISKCQNTFDFTSDHDEFVRRQEEASAEGLRALGKDFFYTYKFIFLGEKYLLALSLDGNRAIIFSENGNKIKELILPRYPIECVVFSINLNKKDYLVVYINQQATSHSSTLFVVDKYFSVQYEEHLLGAKAACFGSSEKYGNYFVIKSEDFWFPNGHEIKTPKVSVNGDWLYFLEEE